MTLVEKVKFAVSENNAPAETTPQWQGGESYVVDDRVQHSGRVYACARNNTGAVAPNLSPFDWEDMGATNPLRFCDEYINTQTKGEPGQTLRLKLGLSEGSINSFGFFGVDGQKITVKDKNENVIWSRSLAGKEESSSWWQYFFGTKFINRNDVWFLGEADYDTSVSIEIEPAGNKAVAIGHLVIGKKIFLGDTAAKPKVSISDYSREITNDWGVTKLRKGATAKYCAIEVVVPTSEVDFVEKTLARTAGELNLFIASERENGFECLAVFGFFRDHELIIANSQTSSLNINLKGVI